MAWLSVLHDLFQAGHYEQVHLQASRLLEQAPENGVVHYYAALALLALNRTPEAQFHVDFLLGQAAGEDFSHHAAARYYFKLGRWKESAQHIQTAVSLDPNSSIYRSEAAVVALRQGKVPEAHAHIESALRLAPDNADVIRLFVQIKGLSESSAREAWQRLRHLEQALALEPDNARLHAAIGDIYLDELDQPREAEQSYRQALLRHPANQDYQKCLFSAVGHQRLLYRLLGIPTRTAVWIRNVAKGIELQPWRIIWFLLGFKAVIVFLCWFLFVTILFWPACTIYEWLLISEIRCASDGNLRHLRLKRMLNRWPFWLRFSLFALLISGLWGAFFGLTGIPLIGGFVTLLTLTAIHFVVVALLFMTRKARSTLGKRAADNRPRPLNIPPVLSH